MAERDEGSSLKMPKSLSLFARFSDLRGAINRETPRMQDRIIADYSKAQGYAWGHEDATGNIRDDSLDFAYAYGIISAKYALEQNFMMPPIVKAYEAWLKGEDITERKW